MTYLKNKLLNRSELICFIDSNDTIKITKLLEFRTFLGVQDTPTDCHKNKASFEFSSKSFCQRN